MCSTVRIQKNFHAKLIKPINKNKIKFRQREEEKDRFTSQVSLVDTSDRLMEEYLARYEGV